MADPRFFERAGPFSLAELAEATGAELSASSDGLYSVNDVAPLDIATGGVISFLDNRKYVETFSKSEAGACIVRAAVVDKAPSGMHLLISDDPYKVYALIAQMFYPAKAANGVVHQRAVIDDTASLGKGCQVDAGAVIGSNVQIGQRCWICANVVVGDGVIIGDDTVIGANASVSHATIGSKVFIYPGVMIGQDGFGFAMSPDGYVKVPQLGRVIIHDDVEVGANSTIDRGAGPDTVIGSGCRIDNLVQIGHNVQMGTGCVIVSQAGVSGSCKLGNYVLVGGQAGIAGHLSIGDGAKVAGKTGVARDVPAGISVAGVPERPAKEYWRMMATLERLVKKK